MILFVFKPWYAFLGIGVILLLLVLVILVKTLLFKDKTVYKEIKPFEGEKDDVLYKLSELIKIPTVSHEDESETDFEKFKEFIDKVQELYPVVFSKCTEYRITEKYAIQIFVKGHSSEKPTVLMAHYDVVPVTEGWDHDPFLGEVVDGYLYGRGTLDTKNTLACALSALEKALENGYIPKNDLYLCFGSNEEVFGDSHFEFIEEFKNKGIKPALVFDEGGGVTTKAFPGVSKDTAFLGMVEKGMANIKLTIDGNGGHSSTPRKNGPIIRMSKALTKLEKHSMKPQITSTVNEMLNVMGRNSSFALKMIFANMWLFKGLVKKLFPVLSADTRALLTSTFAFTIIRGGNQTNVIPNHVEANINVRVAPFNTVDEVVEHIKKVLKDPTIEVTVTHANEMYGECSFKSEGYEIIKQTTLETFDNVVVAPFIMLGGTDARHYNQISDNVIRFSPIKVTNEDRAGIHGLNERIKIENLEKCLDFYQKLLTKI